MPYTLAHVSAVLPAFSRGRFVAETPFVASALVIGAMVPDLPLFLDPFWLGLSEAANTTHKWESVLSINVVIALAIAAIWLVVVRPTVVHAWNQTVPEKPKFSFRIIAFAALTSALGGLTHTFWDSFTHRRGQMVAIVPVLREPFLGVPVFVLLQHGSTVVGLSILALAYWRRRAHRPIRIADEASSASQLQSESKMARQSLYVAVSLGIAIATTWSIIQVPSMTRRFGLDTARVLSVYPVVGALVALLIWVLSKRLSSRPSSKA